MDTFFKLQFNKLTELAGVCLIPWFQNHEYGMDVITRKVETKETPSRLMPIHQLLSIALYRYLSEDETLPNLIKGVQDYGVDDGIIIHAFAITLNPEFMERYIDESRKLSYSEDLMNNASNEEE